MPDPAAGMGWERQTWRSLEIWLWARGSRDAESAPPASPSTLVLHGAGVPSPVPPRGHGHSGAGHRHRVLEKLVLKQAQGETRCLVAPAAVG